MPRFLAVVLALTLTATACGDDADSDSPAADVVADEHATPSTTEPPSTTAPTTTQAPEESEAFPLSDALCDDPANMTTLLVPLYAMAALARRIVAPGTAYVDLSYAQVAKLSATFQGGIVAWVAFWAFYAQGFGAWEAVATFGAAYMAVLLIEPLVDLGLLAAAKATRGFEGSGLVTPRLYA